MAKDFILFKRPRDTGFTLCKGRFMSFEGGITKGIILSTFDKGNQLVMVPEEKTSYPTATAAKTILEPWKPGSRALEIASSSSFYLDLVTRGVEAIKQGRMQKVVLARKQTSSMKPTWFGPVLDSLAKTNPAGFVYLLHSKEFGSWLGASPELLLGSNGGGFETMALAGTRKPDSLIPFLEKEYDEHRIVVDEILQILDEVGYGTAAVEGPAIHNAGKVLHLLSRIRVPAAEEIDHFRLANRLHPTSAVSGYPREIAKAFILENEGFERSLYSGYIGVAEEGKAQYYVNLRCGRLWEGAVSLFAGAGITANSKPEDELAETEAKMTVLKTALGLE